MSIEILENWDLKQYTTFKTGGKAKKVYIPDNITSFTSLLAELKNPIIIGGGSNILISSKGVEQDVIITKKLDKIEFNGNIVSAQCGVKGPFLSQTCQKQGLSGFEFMIGFPGTIGGMVCMNASAHNQAIQDSLKSCMVFDPISQKIIELTKDDLKFGYRKSIIPQNNYIVIGAQFELKISDKEKINELIQRNLEFRKQKQPSLSIPNAGSTFKNPQNDSAGRLLDLAGVKGLTVGGAKVWENHANFIVNFDNADSKDILNLMYKMYNIVKEKYTIELRPEIKYIGIKEAEEKELWQTMTGENTAKIQK